MGGVTTAYHDCNPILRTVDIHPSVKLGALPTTQLIHTILATQKKLLLDREASFSIGCKNRPPTGTVW